jgi:hypothetical protein
MATNRPTSVTVTGWLTIALGTLGILAGPPVFLVSKFMPSPTEFPPDPAFALQYWLLGHFRVVACVQTVVAASALIAGFGFLRMRSWARSYIEVLAWLYLVGTLAIGTLWVRSAVGISRRVSSEPGFPFPPSMFVGTGIVGIVVTVVPTLLVIWALRSKVVRGAMNAG